MAVQQLVGFNVNPGGREQLGSLLRAAKTASEAAGATVRLSAVTVGNNVGTVVATTTHASWDAWADYMDATADNQPTQPVREALQGPNPPATLAGIFHRNELHARDGSDGIVTPFLSGLSFDVTRNRAAVVAAMADLRDVFESLGSTSRVWALATGEDQGRITITSAFDGIAEYARFRGRLEANEGALPLAGVTDDIVGAGIVHTVELEA